MQVNLTGQWVGLLLLGIIFILADVFKWPHPEITWIDRDTEFGEKLNTIIMISLGIIYCRSYNTYHSECINF